MDAPKLFTLVVVGRERDEDAEVELGPKRVDG